MAVEEQNPVPPANALQALDLDYVDVCACYVCGTPDRSPAFRRSYFGHSFSWSRCAGCGLVYQTPKLTRESLWRIYNSSLYWLDGHRSEEGARLGYSDYATNDGYRLRQA
ncbi:MAG TPA: hypothetical protein VF157_10180, partial [Chloroflexota bacterium]